ncbi:MAG: DUF1385 domain-containing protein [Candidatus Bathyarchaeota archaeon]|nr:MAG: DUF1385 domain-containing protein [Candidatus Bathyarchaeota archaeon]
MLLAEGGDKPSLAFGGQALIEGVMMRSSAHLVICVRQPDTTILTHTEEITSLTKSHKLLGLPLVRGIISLFETFYLGIKGIYFSANAVLDEEEKFTYKELAVALALALGLTSLFIIIPFLLTTLLIPKGVLFNIIEAIIRLTLFFLYLTLVASWGEFRRILQYHGAEHKTINAHEAGVILNIENVKEFPRLHPRCGTSFIFIVIIISILLFSLIPNIGLAPRLAYRMLLIPVIGAISYELLKLSGRYRNSPVTRILTMPGLAFQRLTTREPDDDMIEVALKAVKEVKRLDSS